MTMTRRLGDWATMWGRTPPMWGRTPRWTRALVIVLAGFAMAPAGATAATGDLTPPAGTLGCVEYRATSAMEGCLEAAPGFGLDTANVLTTYGTSVYVASNYGIEVLERDSSDAGLSDVQCLQATRAEGCTAAQTLTSAYIKSLTVSPDGKTL